MNDLSGQQFGNYRLTRLLGQGGFADTYLGEQIYIHTYAAVKIVQAQLEQGDQESFFNEARVIAHLSHPNIVRLIDFGVSGNRNTPYLIMNYAPNGTLRQRHPRGEIVPVARVAQYVRDVAAALQYAHEQKIVHRDVKPENMLIAANQEVLLSDFGIAVVQSSRVQNPSSVAGTMTYMAPEQIQGHALPASDQYALAVVVYEWLCGVAPFNGSYAEIAGQHANTSPLPLRQRVGTISADVEQVVLTALAKDPQRRFRTVQAFANAFEQASKSETGSLQGASLMDSQSNIPTARASYSTDYADPHITPSMPQSTAYGAPSDRQNFDLEEPPPPPSYVPPSGSYNPQTPPPTVPEPSGAGFTPRLTPPMSAPSTAPQYTPQNYAFVAPDASGRQANVSGQGQPVTGPPPATEKGRRPPTYLLILLAAAIVLIVGGVLLVYANVYQPYMHSVQATATVGAQTARTAQAHANATASVVAQATATRTALQDTYTQATSGTPILDVLLRSPDNYGWTHLSNSSYTCDFIDGTYHARAQTGYFGSCYASATNYIDFAYQVQVKVIAGSQAGIIYRAPNSDTDNSSYQFMIGTDGTYLLDKVTVDKQGNHFPTLISGSSPAIHKGLNQTNLVSVVAHGNTFYLYVNKQYVNQASDDAYKNGAIGVVAVSSDTSGTEAAFSNAQVWQLV
jgi:eukaryotic-like serine/threonine-protein kinase